MPSLMDIPQHIRETPVSGLFVNWLVRQPVTYAVRRELASIWSKHTGHKLTAEEHALLKDNADD